MGPLDVQQKEFRVSRFGGYKMRDVDEFLDHITDSMSAMAAENDRLRKGAPASSIVGTPDLADVSRQADEIIQRARAEAARIVTEAKSQAARDRGRAASGSRCRQRVPGARARVPAESGGAGAGPRRAGEGHGEDGQDRQARCPGGSGGGSVFGRTCRSDTAGAREGGGEASGSGGSRTAEARAGTDAPRRQARTHQTGEGSTGAHRPDRGPGARLGRPERCRPRCSRRRRWLSPGPVLGRGLV